MSGLPSEAINLNVEGRQVVGALQGFGQLWQKTYWVRLSGAARVSSSGHPDLEGQLQQLLAKRQPFSMPPLPASPLERSQSLNIATGGMPLSTGVMVIYDDDESFTFMTPEGHVFSGWITSSAYESEGSTVAQTQLLVRANDPLYEIGLRLGGSKAEDRFWHHTLSSLAASFGVEGQVQMTTSCVDPRLQWSHAKNIWHNAAIRTAIYTAIAPLRWARNLGPTRAVKRKLQATIRTCFQNPRNPGRGRVDKTTVGWG